MPAKISGALFTPLIPSAMRGSLALGVNSFNGFNGFNGFNHGPTYF
jgi:hypothetical protein